MMARFNVGAIFLLLLAAFAGTGLAVDVPADVLAALQGGIGGGGVVPATGSPSGVLLLQQIQDLLGEEATAELIQQIAAQLLAGGDTEGGGDLANQIQAQILEQLINDLLMGSGSPAETLQQIGELLSNPIVVAFLEDYLNELLGGVVTIPDGLIEQIADQLSATGLPPINDLLQPWTNSSLLQQLEGLLTDAANNTSLTANSTIVEGVLEILNNLGLLDELQGTVNWEQLAATLGSEVQRYVEEELLTNVSSSCVADTMQFLNDSASGQAYAGQMWLSNGDFVNIQVATTYNVASYGNVEQCQHVKAWNPDAPFETKHCNFRYTIEATAVAGTQFVLGLCVPQTCSPEDLKEMFEMVPALGENSFFECMTDYPWNTGAIATVCLLCFFVLLVAFGTVYHVICHRRVLDTIAESKAIVKEREGYPTEKKGDIFFKEKVENNNGHADKKHIEDYGYDIDQNMVDIPDLEQGPTSSTEKIAHIHCDCAVRASKKRIKKLGRLDAIMMGFSSLHNGSKIMNTEQPAGSLGALNGIRVISMWWIILGHSFQFIPDSLDDPRYVQTEVAFSVWFSAILYSTVSVDTFFFLSGLLLTYLTLKHLKKAEGKINWILFYVHRFIRITPAYMVAIAIWTTLVFHFGDGPGKNYLFELPVSRCREYWWTNLLYISNLYPFPGELNAQCMGWSWYLANDMQFFIISPIIIYLLYKYSKWGMATIIALCFGSFGITAYLAYHYGVAVGFRGPYNNNTIVDYGTPTPDVIYTKPYCRIPTYLIGMVTGFLIYKWNGQPFKMNKWFNAAMWLASVGVGLAVIYGPYRYDNADLPQAVSVLYIVLSRPAFVTAVGWVTFSCTMGYGGPVNTFLSWGFWAPLSRITFGAYLLHPILIFIIYGTAKTQYHFTYMQFAALFISNTVFAYAAAFLLSLGVEGPIMGLEKALLGGARSKKK